MRSKRITVVCGSNWLLKRDRNHIELCNISLQSFVNWGEELFKIGGSWLMGLKVFAAIVIAAMVPVSALAHHSFGMFDLQKNVTYTGTVVEYNWENPHSHIIL